jgi:diguanylate cyclase
MTNKSDELDCDYAAFIAERVVSLMSRLKIAQTPANYAIWFSYCQGTSPGLKRAIDTLFEKESHFDASTSAALIANFGNGETAVVVPSDVTKRLGSLMEDAQGFLQIAIADNRKQMQAMGEAATEAGAGTDPGELIDGLISELSKSVSRASKLEKNFVEATRELSQIRVSLDHAEKRAKTDVLTGLPNRLAFEDFFCEAQMAAAESRRPLSVLLIDVDHFKRFNDDFGHGVGDQVLRLIAKVLRERVRDQDLPARYGGEELIAVFPNSDLKTSTAVGESIRRSISECNITRRSSGEVLPGITVSIGVAQLQAGESMTDLIERCDRALYRAKNAGRNRVVACEIGLVNPLASVPLLTDDSQIGANLPVCADEENRADWDQRG